MRQIIRWSREEAIILLNALLMVLDNRMARRLAVSLVSNELRKRAVDSGLEIDAVFRNTNGINLQMNIMEYLLTDGRSGLKKTSYPVVFDEVVDLYKTNPQEFYVQLSQLSAGAQLLEHTESEKRNVHKETPSRSNQHLTGSINTDKHTKRKITQVTAKSVKKKESGVRAIDNKEQRLFLQWLKKRGYSSTHAKSILETLEHCSNLTATDNTQVDFLIINKQRQLVKALAELKKKDSYIKADKESGGKYSEALTLLFQFKQDKPLAATDVNWQNKERMKLYQKLYSISQVYDDPSGLTISKIMSLLGKGTDGQSVRDILDGAPWAIQLSDEKYTFSQTKESINKEPTDYDKDKFVQTLLHRFRNGMQFDSIDFENFRELYETLYDESLSFNDAELEARLRYCGVYYKDRLFPAEGIIDGTTKEKLFQFIENSFSSGKKVLYYKAIFEELADVFSSCFVLSDENMLRAYIEYTAEKGKYYFSSKYMSMEESVSINHVAEVEEYLLSAGKPMTIKDMSVSLSHIPKDQLSLIINNGHSFLRNAKGEYFHVDIFEISDTEIECIANIINGIIQKNEYAIWTDVWKMIQEELPEFLENNLYLSSTGVRNVLAQKYIGRFNFESAVISMPKDKYAMGDIYQLYAKHHAEFSTDEIIALSKKLDTGIYFDALAKVSVRVSHDLFVSKDRIHFDVSSVDKAIGSFMSKDYICIREIDSFLSFPNVGYEWNEYLLESFVCSYSKKYKLLNNGLSRDNVAGAVAKKTGTILEFVDACAAVLADAPITLNKQEVLDYLANINMITRRSYRDVELAIAKAKEIRAMKG